METVLFRPGESLLLIIDVQERLWPFISNADQVRDRCQVMMKGAEALEVPVLISEQYPKGLGPTLPAIRDCQPLEAPVFEKTAFGCLGDDPLAEYLESAGRRQLVVCGIETHVCVLQTVLEAVARGYRCAVVADAVGSREAGNRQLALDRMRQEGASIVSSEIILFEWMKNAKHPAFKTISALVK
jgi:nicotinamidase-related amidase